MKFVLGVIVAMGVLIAANLGMISIDIEQGNVLDFTKETAKLDMVKKSTQSEARMAEETTMVESEETSAPMTAEVELGIGSGVPGCEETNECYIPYEVSISVGGTVTWINDDAGHTVTAGDLQEDPNSVGTAYPNGFDSGFFLAGNNYSYTFEIEGEYPYYCQVHPWMIGIVYVE